MCVPPHIPFPGGLDCSLGIEFETWIFCRRNNDIFNLFCSHSLFFFKWIIAIYPQTQPPTNKTCWRSGGDLPHTLWSLMHKTTPAWAKHRLSTLLASVQRELCPRANLRLWVVCGAVASPRSGSHFKNVFIAASEAHAARCRLWVCLLVSRAKAVLFTALATGRAALLDCSVNLKGSC